MWSFMSVRLLGKYKQPLVNLSGLIKRRQKNSNDFHWIHGYILST